MRTIATIAASMLLAASSAAALAQDPGVARAQFTTAIEDREPVNDFFRIDNDTGRVVFFTELRDLDGRTVTHRWMHDGEVQATVDFEVGGPRWRVWSSKDLIPAWTGAWTVEVVDDTGGLHGRWTFVYKDASM